MAAKRDNFVSTLGHQLPAMKLRCVKMVQHGVEDPLIKSHMFCCIEFKIHHVYMTWLKYYILIVDALIA